MIKMGAAPIDINIPAIATELSIATADTIIITNKNITVDMIIVIPPLIAASLFQSEYVNSLDMHQ